MPQINYYTNIGSTPARVNRRTGEIQLNVEKFPYYSELIQRYIIEHEKGHFLLKTRNEVEADEYAFNQIAGTAKGSVKNGVRAISKVLRFTKPEAFLRLREALKRASLYDWKQNGNERAKILYNKLISEQMEVPEDNYEDNYEENSNLDYDEFVGKKKRKAKRKARKAKRVNKRKARKAKRKAPPQQEAPEPMEAPEPIEAPEPQEAPQYNEAPEPMEEPPQEEPEPQEESENAEYDQFLGLKKGFLKKAVGKIFKGKKVKASSPVNMQNSTIGAKSPLLDPATTQVPKLLGMPAKTAYIVIGAGVLVLAVVLIFVFKKK